MSKASVVRVRAAFNNTAFYTDAKSVAALSTNNVAFSLPDTGVA